MPNHITTIITGPATILDHLTRTRTAQEIAEINEREDKREQFFRERGQSSRFTRRTLDPTERIIDFGILIPQPDNLEQDSCSGTHAPGVVCWYEWNPENWGTKWNGYNYKYETSDGACVPLNRPNTVCTSSDCTACGER